MQAGSLIHRFTVCFIRHSTCGLQCAFVRNNIITTYQAQATLSSQHNNFPKCNAKMTAKTTTKVGNPRMDPTERLRHRFYEPPLLLVMLNPCRNGGHGQPTIAFRNRNFVSDWRRFLDALAWFGDYQHGGKTVTAVAAESLPAGVHPWVASTHER